MGAKDNDGAHTHVLEGCPEDEHGEDEGGVIHPQIRLGEAS